MTPTARRALLDRIETVWSQAPDLGLEQIVSLLDSAVRRTSDVDAALRVFEAGIAGMVDRRRDLARRARREAGAG